MNDTIDVSVRRSPKYSAFIILGVLVGFVIGGIVSFLPTDTSQLETEVTQASATWMLMVICGIVCGFIGAAVALVLDRLSLRRARTYSVPAEEEPEAVVESAPEAPAGSAPEAPAGSAPEAPAGSAPEVEASSLETSAPEAEPTSTPEAKPTPTHEARPAPTSGTDTEPGRGTAQGRDADMRE